MSVDTVTDSTSAAAKTVDRHPHGLWRAAVRLRPARTVNAEPGYTAQAEISAGGFLGLWASRHAGQPDEPVVLYDRDGLRATWQPEQLHARVTVGSTSVLVVADQIQVGQFETVLRSLRALDR
jgi:hypothetical protein